MICDVLADRPLGLLVAAAAWIGLLVLLLTGPVTRHQVLVVALGTATCATLLFTAVLQGPQWYLAARGRQTTATVVEPYRTWSHGARIAYCRVRRLPLAYSEQLFDPTAKIAEMLRLERK